MYKNCICLHRTCTHSVLWSHHFIALYVKVLQSKVCKMKLFCTMQILFERIKMSFSPFLDEFPVLGFLASCKAVLGSFSLNYQVRTNQICCSTWFPEPQICHLLISKRTKCLSLWCNPKFQNYSSHTLCKGGAFLNRKLRQRKHHHRIEHLQKTLAIQIYWFNCL